MNETELLNQIEQGRKVKWIRSQLGWTQRQMVTYLKKIDRTNQSNYCNMENGKLPLLWCSGEDSRRGCLSCKHYNSSYVCQLHQFEHWAGSSCDDWVLDKNRFGEEK